MPFRDVHHQERAVNLLQQALDRNRVPHAYIFHGPEGVGKETTARALASVLLQTDADVAKHPDLHVVDRMLARFHPNELVRRRSARELIVDVVRHFLIAPAYLTATAGTAKVFIVRQGQLMNVQAQNALLKTLEEPPANTFIILLVDELDSLLPTTASRCQAIPFATLPDRFIRERLRLAKAELSESHLDFYTALADGSLGAAIQMAEDDFFSIGNSVIELLRAINTTNLADANKAWDAEASNLGKHFKARDSEITETEAKRRGLAWIIRLASSFYDDILRMHTSNGTPNAFTFQKDVLQRATERIQTHGACDAIERLVKAQYQIRRNANLGLVLDNLINDLRRLQEGARHYA